MTTSRASAAEADKSIEAKLSDDDAEMNDGVEEELSEIDAEGESVNGIEGGHDVLQSIKDLTNYLCKVEQDGEELVAGFQRIPNRRVLPDYFEVISEPIAFSTIRSKILKKLYHSMSEFVKDVAQICHNAQVYNRPSAPVFGAAETLRETFKKELQKLVERGEITATEAEIPNLGELPPAEDSPPPDSDEEDDEADDEDEDEDEDDDEEDEDEDDSGNEGVKSRRRRARWSRTGRADQDDDRDDDAHKKRGRPPSVLTPMEARISSILRGIRKPKDEDGSLLILPFERLPDKNTLPDYYQTIKNPISLDQIKKRAKRKNYQNVDEALADMELMFENAKLYNEDDSPIYKAAVELQKQARILVEQEKAKPDDDFRDEDGKLPLAEIQHHGQTWRVGDWVHIRNPNDLAKPIVAQVFRTWQDREGRRWINACWYYRPEQTVHRFDKHFFEHEVVKTGQYRDHQIEDVLDHCFVMFVTRFPKGRPRGFPADKAVYVCESRYNEVEHRLNKIKTWASCLPDEVREKDYVMDLFEQPRRIRKSASPIKHLLREDAKETDDLPKPTWGSPDAPPIVGAVHRRPREVNESPPPEPTPPLIPRTVTTLHDGAGSHSMISAMSQEPVRTTPGELPGAAPAQSPGHHAHTTSNLQSNTPISGAHSTHQTPVPIPHQAQYSASQPQYPIRPMPYQQQPAPQPTQQQLYPQKQYQYQQSGFAPQQQPPQYAQSPIPPMQHRQSFGNATAPSYNHMQAVQPSRTPIVATSGNVVPHNNMYNPPRSPEVYTLADSVNDMLPEGARQNFQHDEAGRVLFFTAPPLDRMHKGLSPECAGLGHSVKYLADREKWLAERTRKRKERDWEKKAADRGKRDVQQAAQNEQVREETMLQAAGALGKWFQRFDQDTAQFTKIAGLEGWHQPDVKHRIS